MIDNSPHVHSGLGIDHLKKKGIEIIKYKELEEIIKSRLFPITYF